MTDHTTVHLTVSLISIFTGIVVSAQSSQQCSSFCVCDSWYKLQRASCTGRHLYSVDTGAPINVQALDLSDNVISLLSSYELANAGLTKLKYLNLSGNAISVISLNSFDGLPELTILDLSRNHLYYVLDDVFAENKNLRILKLSNNNFNSHVPKLRSVWLMELSLDSCQISHLPSDAFNGLTHLRRLDLSNNLMIQMSSTIVQTLHLLKKLSLKGNPWSCNKIMYDLRIYLEHKNIEFDEICGMKANSKTFERMVLLPITKQHSYHHPAIANKSIQETKSVINYNVVNSKNNKNLSTSENTANQTNNVNSMDHFLPYWFLFAGFILGVSSGMIISYIWLSGTFSCNRRYRHRERLNEVSQMLSLLYNSYVQGHVDSDASLIESCPGTPPPPYREVMLRPNLYRYPSTASNLNNNDTGYRSRYM